MSARTDVQSVYIRDEFPNGTVGVAINVRDGEVWGYEKALTKNQAKRLISKVERKGDVNLVYWVHLRTIYGSLAYERNGVEAKVRECEMSGRNHDLWKCM